jgi:hypothetical protein
MSDVERRRRARRTDARKEESIKRALRWLEDAFWGTDIDPEKKRHFQRRVKHAYQPMREARACYDTVKHSVNRRVPIATVSRVSVANLDLSAAQEVMAARLKKGWVVDEGQLHHLESALVRRVIRQWEFDEICMRLSERR